MQFFRKVPIVKIPVCRFKQGVNHQNILFLVGCQLSKYTFFSGCQLSKHTFLTGCQLSKHTFLTGCQLSKFIVFSRVPTVKIVRCQPSKYTCFENGANHNFFSFFLDYFSMFSVSLNPKSKQHCKMINSSAAQGRETTFLVFSQNFPNFLKCVKSLKNMTFRTNSRIHLTVQENYSFYRIVDPTVLYIERLFLIQVVDDERMFELMIKFLFCALCEENHPVKYLNNLYYIRGNTKPSICLIFILKLHTVQVLFSRLEIHSQYIYLQSEAIPKRYFIDKYF